MKIYAATFLHAKDQREVIKEGKYLHRLYSFYFIKEATKTKSFKEVLKET